MSFDDLIPLLRLSFRDPAGVYRRLRALDLPVSASWMALSVSVLLSTLLVAFAAMSRPEAMMPILLFMIARPLPFALMQLAGLAVGTWFLTVLGRAVGGRGRFADLLLGMAWIELLFLAAQVVQTVLVLVSPLLASLVGLAASILVVWVSVQIVKAAHGFSNAILVFFGMIVSFIVTILFLSVLAAALGLVPDIPAEVQP